jgi:hypothetical protein
MLETRGNVDAERPFETVAELLDEYLDDAEPELAVELFALDLEDVAFDAQLACGSAEEAAIP